MRRRVVDAALIGLEFGWSVFFLAEALARGTFFFWTMALFFVRELTRDWRRVVAA